MFPLPPLARYPAGLVALALFFLPGAILADDPDTDGEAIGVHEIHLTLPGVRFNKVTIEPESGWPLTAVLTANEQKLLGIGVPVTPPLFPARENTGFLLFDDPDGCPSFIAEGFQSESGGCPPPPWPFDETWVEFTPGLTVPGEGVEQPQVLTFDFDTGMNDKLSGIGPTGLSDDYGYGPSDRLPGLVVVADAGPSIVTDELFDRPEPLECRNLAGFANSVGYELRDAHRKTSITAHFNIPSRLFTPVALVDRSVTVGSFCPGGTLIRFDGGELSCIEGPPINTLDFLVNQQVVTARVFVVNGVAPDQLQDLNGNGICDIDDAQLAGEQTLSTERVVRFRQLHELYFGFAFDFDGDGDIGDTVAPGGPGALTQPPR